MSERLRKMSEELEEVEEELGCNSKKNDKDIEANVNGDAASSPKKEKNIFFQAFLIGLLVFLVDLVKLVCKRPSRMVLRNQV